MEDKLCTVLSENKDLRMILNILDTFSLKNYYVYGEYIFQSIWNYLQNQPFTYKNRRISIVYYDEENTSLKKEVQLEKELLKILSRYGMFYEITIHNYARVHLERVKHPILNRVEEGSCRQFLMESSMSIASVGITQEKGELCVCAPYGSKDIFDKVIRPVYHAYASPQTYTRQSSLLSKEWKDLTIIPYTHKKNNL